MKEDDAFDGRTKKRLKYIYKYVGCDMCHTINKRKELLDEFYAEDVPCDKLLNRIRAIKAEQTVKPNIVMSLIVGVVASMAFWIVCKIAEFLESNGDATFSGVAVAIAVAFILGYVGEKVVSFIVKSCSNMFVDYNNLFLKPYELKLIKEKLRSEYGFIWEK